MLTRWDPFREMLTMRRTMDQLIEDSIKDDPNGAPDWGLPLDVVEDEDSYIIKASIPGIKSDDLDITYNKGLLTIKGELKDESETTKGQYHLRERRFGRFMRTVSLPTSVKADDINANFQDGILTLRMPKAEEVKPKRISVKSDNKTIESKVK